MKYEIYNINWKLEAEYINTYTDYHIKPNKESVLDYIKFIVELKGKKELYNNEKRLYKILRKEAIK